MTSSQICPPFLTGVTWLGMDDGHTSLLLGPFFYAHVVKICSQDYLTIRRKPLLLKPWLLFIFTRKFLLLTDRGFSACQSLQFIRGLQGFTDTSPSTVFVRGNRWPNYQEVVTRYPLCGSSELLYLVGCIQGQSTLSFGLIVPDNRYVMHHLIRCLITR